MQKHAYIAKTQRGAWFLVVQEGMGSAWYKIDIGHPIRGNTKLDKSVTNTTKEFDFASIEKESDCK